MQQLPVLPSYPVRFPDPSTALEEPEGLLAAGGALTPQWLTEAYATGVFPWFNSDDGPIYWWSPIERAVLNPGEMKVSRSLSKRIRNSGFEVSFDQDFASVVAACAESRADSVGTWITPKMQAAYCELYRCGFAHSVEVWDDGDLIGGLYGISLGRMFFGESMFSQRTDTSKIAFYRLNQKLREWRFTLVDCQMMNPHLESLGVKPMQRHVFLNLLAKNDLSTTRLGSWQSAEPLQQAREEGSTQDKLNDDGARSGGL